MFLSPLNKNEKRQRLLSCTHKRRLCLFVFVFLFSKKMEKERLGVNHSKTPLPLWPKL